MKLKINRRIFLFATLVFQCFVFFIMLSKNIMIKSSAVKNNRVYSFDCTVYDPYNVLKGRFVQLQITQAGVDESRLAESSFYRRESLSLVEKKIFYLLIKTDSNDNFYVYDIMKTKPLSGDFIKAKYKYRVSDTLYFDFMINEYYLQENLAEYVDSSRNNEFGTLRLDVYSDGKGNLLQKQLYVLQDNEYIGIEDYIKEK